MSALFRSVLEGIGSALPDSNFLVFDNGVGFREASAVLDSGASFSYRRVGARGGRRYYAFENLATMTKLASLGAPAARFHPILREIDRCSAVLDVSGGDSFSDIYGQSRFLSVVRPKLIAARRGVPLIFLPQTYGPFRDSGNRELAREAVLGATIAWARDPRSFNALKSLLGDRFDPSRHKQGVDMAFALSPSDPGSRLDRQLHEWLEKKDDHLVAGINVSGLVALDPKEAQSRFQLKADYLGALVSFIEALLSESNVRLLLIPHVMAAPGSPESDAQACAVVLERLPASLRERVRITPRDLDERGVKWLISKLDWFCGMRMHSTIAGLSSLVPTTAVAYSDKTRGVFETCEVGDQVIDPRELGTGEVIERLKACWQQRSQTATTLIESIPKVKARAAEQFADVVATASERRRVA